MKIIRDSKQQQQRQNANAEHCIIPHCSIFIYIFNAGNDTQVRFNWISTEHEYNHCMIHFQFFPSLDCIFSYTLKTSSLFFFVQHIGLKIIMVFLGPWTDSTNFCFMWLCIDIHIVKGEYHRVHLKLHLISHSFLLLLLFVRNSMNLLFFAISWEGACGDFFKNFLPFYTWFLL